MATTTMVHVRLDQEVKARATETLAAMGLTVSGAVRVFFMRVVAEQQLPFPLKVPNAQTRAAMNEAGALFDNLEKKPRQISAPACPGPPIMRGLSRRMGSV